MEDFPQSPSAVENRKDTRHHWKASDKGSPLEKDLMVSKNSHEKVTDDRRQHQVSPREDWEGYLSRIRQMTSGCECLKNTARH